MKYEDKTKEQLINELMEMQRRVTELEASENQRKRAEEEIEKLAKFPSENPQPVLRVAKDGTILYANKASLPLLNVWGCQIGQLLPEYWRKFIWDIFSSSLTKNIEVEYEDRIFSLTLAPIVDTDYVNLYGLDITERKRAEEELRKHREHLEDLVKERTVELTRVNELLQQEITERKRVEETLRESEVRLAGIVGAVMDHMSMIDEQHNIVWTNDVTKRVFGPDLVGKKCYMAYHRRDKVCEPCIAKKTLAEGKSHEHETEVIRADGRQMDFWCKTSVAAWYPDGRPKLVIEVSRDITERKKMQERLVHSEKLAVLGQLAGGVGHELRNPLGAIKNAAYFLNMVLEKPEPEVKETLEILERQVGACEKIISSLLDFARPKPPAWRKVDINQVVQEALSDTPVPENVEIVSQLGEALPTILADPDQLTQVFKNLILNSIQAMPEGGQLVVKSEAESPKWMVVSITDTGVGISEEHLERLFEPLFTTKVRGIGLGLAVTKILVEGHGGTIEVQSKLEEGSTFTVRLPLGGEEK